MKRTGCALLVAVLALWAPPVLGQTTEPPPSPPPGMPGETPVPQSQAPQPAGPERKKLVVTEEETEEKEAEPEVQWGIGARSYFTFLPRGVIELFVAHGTGMTSASFALSLIRRKGNFDFQITVEYGNYSPDDGLWEEKGEVPGQTPVEDNGPDLKHFDGLGMISADASFIWHTDLTDFMAFRYGAGIGVGIKTGRMLGTDYVCETGTTNDDLDNPSTSKCRPKTGAQPVEDDLPPVLPVVNLLVGLRFKIVDELSLNIEAGYRFPAFFAGGGIGYFF